MANPHQEVPIELEGLNPAAAANEIQPEEVTTTVIRPEDAAMGAAAVRERQAAAARARAGRGSSVHAAGYPSAKFVPNEPEPESFRRRLGRIGYKIGRGTVLTVLKPITWPLRAIYEHSKENKLMTVGTVGLGTGLAVLGAYGADAAFGRVVDYQDILASTALTPITFPLASKLFRESFKWASHNVNYVKDQAYNQLQVNFAGRMFGLIIASGLAFTGGIWGKEQAQFAYDAYTAIPRVTMREIPSTAMHLFAPHLSNTQWDPGWNLSRHARCLQYKALDPSSSACISGPGSDAIQMTVDMDRLRATFGEQAVPQTLGAGRVTIQEAANDAAFYTPRGASRLLFGQRFGGLPAGHNLVLQ